MTQLELLAPARDLDVARQAILHGADAVYMGGPSHGARAAAGNSMADIAAAADLAHRYGAKVYATLNTIVYDAELEAVEALARQYWSAGVDALIVQDMALLQMALPPIELHASTQCDIRTPEKAAFLASQGFTQLVLPRELSLAEIEAMHRAVPPGVKLEAFVHGALCVSYSGDCQASCLANGRSANRGECAQMCRMAYDLVDAQGQPIVRDKHLLSLRDLNRLADVGAMARAGIQSFKIEGRLKDAAYVKNVVGAYRRALDRVIAASGGEYCRSSLGQSRLAFEPDVAKAFNRGFTPYFISASPGGKGAPKGMACFDTPKWVGEPVGKVVRSQGRQIEAKLTAKLSNGDGLGYFDADGRFAGFRLNRIEGSTLHLASPVALKPGTELYRNSDAQREALLARPTAERLIDLRLTLRAIPGGRIALRGEAEGGACVEAVAEAEMSEARTPQREQRLKALSKLGGTPFTLAALDDQLADDAFVPASALAALRRRVVELLSWRKMPLPARRIADPEAKYPKKVLDYHDNVANRLAEDFYRSHGVEQIERAIETQPRPQEPRIAMTTRYCLRRELGACLREPGARKLPSPLYLVNKAARYELLFDCARCQMQLRTAPEPKG